MVSALSLKIPKKGPIGPVLGLVDHCTSALKPAEIVLAPSRASPLPQCPCRAQILSHPQYLWERACPRRGQNNPRRFQCRSAMIDKSQNRTDRSLFGNLQPGAETFVARGLAPVGLRSSPKTCNRGVSGTPRTMVYDCCAAERGQAPSPQGPTAWGFVFKSLSAGMV